MKTYDDLREAEEQNYQASLQRVGDTASLAQDFADAYESISQLLRQTMDPPQHIQVISMLFLASRYQLERAVLDILRGRLTDGTQATRRAIELAAFAAKADRHPHLADVWLEASHGEISYKKYPELTEKLITLPEKLGEAGEEVVRRLNETAAQSALQLIEIVE